MGEYVFKLKIKCNGQLKKIASKKGVRRGTHKNISKLPPSHVFAVKLALSPSSMVLACIVKVKFVYGLRLNTRRLSSFLGSLVTMLL